MPKRCISHPRKCRYHKRSVAALQDAIWYAYFAPYPYERHEELIAEVSRCSHPLG